MRYYILDIFNAKGHLFTHLYGLYAARKTPDMMPIALAYVPDAKSVKYIEVSEEVVHAFHRLGHIKLPPDWQPKPKKPRKKSKDNENNNNFV